jgi:hypothetical protein
MKTRNTKITNIEEHNGVGYFDIDCGRFGTMIFEFYIEFNVDSDYDLESVDVKIGKYDWESENENLKSGMLNKRNTKFICEYIESVILDDPQSYGFDEEDFMRKDVEEFDYCQELNFDERRYSNM